MESSQSDHSTESSSCGNSPRRTHILTIALEDYFHGAAFRGLIHPRSWGRFETRFEKSAMAALELLSRSGSRATFFAGEWIARQRPSVLEEILRQGHEIALSGAELSFRFLRPAELRNRVRRGKASLEQACGHSILGYRQSDVLLRPKDLWAFDVLAEEGFLYDSSLSPTAWTFREQPWRRFVHRQQFGARQFWEFPLSSQSVAGTMVPFAGGNYFRQFPESLVRWSIRNWEALHSDPLVLYFRLWDLDPEQPHIETGSFVRELRHYRNGPRMVRMIREMFDRYRFDSIAGTLGVAQVPVRVMPALVSPQVSIRSAHDAAIIRRPISVIIPCYNEEATIPYLSRALEELRVELAPRYDVQFIVVDDGSRDNTWARLNEYFGAPGGENEGENAPLLIRHEVNSGVAAAIATGLKYAREIACSMDCDCSYDPRELAPMLDLMTEGVDLVTASPYHPEGHVANVPSWRIGLSRSASLMYQVVTGRKLHTFTSCLRVYRRSAALATPLKHGGFLGVAELAGKFAVSGRRIVEHPATLELRLFGQSKMKIIRTIGGHLGLMASLVRSRITPVPAAAPVVDTTPSQPVPVPAGVTSSGLNSSGLNSSGLNT
jgi:polysaccharide deacetylase family protein (PEP-CTERM system associated)